MKKIRYVVLIIALIVSTGLKSEEIQKVIIDDMYFDHITATADGGYLSLSLLLDKDAEYNILTKHDANGRILWKKNLGDDVVWDFVELEDGSLVFVGKRYNIYADGGVIYFKLSPCGDFLWG